MPALLALMGFVATADSGNGRGNGNGRVSKPLTATASLKDGQGRRVGTVRLLQVSRRTVEVRVTAARLTPGFHGLHVHEAGVCNRRTRDPNGRPAPFLSAGGHLRRGGQGHASHTGDLAPLLVMRNRRARTRFNTDRFRVRQLFDANRSAIIVHALRDNFANIPTRYHAHTPDASSTTFGPDAATLATGDSGGRVACGVVRFF